MLFKIILLTIGAICFSPSSFSNSDKSFSKLDLLSSYIQLHSTNNELVSTHIAQAIILAGGDTKTLTAIARVESSFSPSVRGDGKASVGCFQIQPKHWGVVPSSIYSQAKKARGILQTVGSIKNYNGCGEGARIYEAKVLRIRKEITFVKT